MSAIDNRPVATYPGDTTDTVGQLVGPTLAGETLVVDEAVYDEAARSTRGWRAGDGVAGVRWRQFWPMFAGMTVAGAAAVVASASTLAALARAAGWAGWTPWLLPAALDVAGAVGGWCWLRPGAPERARWFGRVVAIVGALGTLVGNGCGHLVASRYLVPGPVLVVVVGAVPAAVLVALAHLTALLATGGADVTQVTAGVSGETGPQVPMREQASTPADTTVPAPRGVKGPRKLPTNSVPDDALEAAARDVAHGLREAGVRVTRRSLTDGLRAGGHGVGTTRAGQLLAALDDQEAAA